MDPGGHSMGAFWFFLAMIGTAGLSFIAVMTWLAQRKKEREQYYQTETMKKIAESGASGPAIEYLRERDRLAREQSRGALQLIGLILIAAGVGLFLMLGAIAVTATQPEERAPIGVALIGVVPLLIGVAIFGYARLGVPKS